MSVDDAVRRIRRDTALEPVVALVLGSGLGGLVDEVEERVELPYSEIPGWPVSTAVGHAGVLALGTFAPRFCRLAIRLLVAQAAQGAGQVFARGEAGHQSFLPYAI